MELKQCIETRRSIRRFTAEPVSSEQLRELIRLASFAPSWKNTQTVRWIALTDRAAIDRLAAGPALGHPGNQGILQSAPLVLVQTCISGRSGFERDGSYSTPKGDRWEMFDAGIAAQTLCLAAHDMGLGTVIMGAVDTLAVAEVLGLDSARTVSCLIAVGHPDQQPLMPKRKTVDELLS